MRVPVALGALLLVPVLGACSSGDDGDASAAGQPRVDWIDDTFAAVADARGGEPAYLEVAATLEHVDVIVRDGDGADAVLYRYDGERLDGPVEPRADERPTFTDDEVTIDPDRIFDGIRAELTDPAIVDLAVRREGEALIVDATVVGDQGGLIFVLLAPDGQVLGIQAE